MKEQRSIFEYPRWTILLDKKEALEFEETDFKVIARQDNLFNDDYAILEIEGLTFDDGYTAEEVMTMTGALAVHEEFTNATITTPDSLDDIADDMYCWNGAGNIFLGDMLTDIERLNFLMKNLYDEYKNLVTVDKIEIKLTKDSQPIPLSDNVEKLFTNDAYSIIYEGHEITLWWANIIEDRGLFLVVIDEDYEDEDEDDDEDVKKLLPAPKYTNPYYDYWDDVYGYDSYDYDDRYYQRT
jgi:hypothetical protein